MSVNVVKIKSFTSQQSRFYTEICTSMPPQVVANCGLIARFSTTSIHHLTVSRTVNPVWWFLALVVWMLQYDCSDILYFSMPKYVSDAKVLIENILL